MSEFSKIYNLGRLGQTGDEVALETSAEERAGLAKMAEVLEVPEFSAKVALRKISPTRFVLSYALAAKVIQACVVSLAPVAAAIARDFTRELHFTPNLKREKDQKEIIVEPGEEELPEEIGSLHYDLAGPLTEEFLLALDPYPRAPGVAFEPPEAGEPGPESPFAVLKALKSPG